MNQKELLVEFYKNKNYDYLKSVLQMSDIENDKNFLAKIYVKENDYLHAGEIYRSLGYLYEYGRCLLLQGKFDKAKSLWLSIDPNSSAVLWGRSLIEFIELYVEHLPTFFQIRSFLEMDLDALLNANLIGYCENIINGADLFAKSNTESYKFIARVLVNNHYHKLAEVFLEKAKEICYVDPEVHFLCAKCSLFKNDTKEAKKSLKIAIDKGFGYYPAKKLLNEINLA